MGIGRGDLIKWAPRSADLTSLDFFLWGHVKNNMYKTSVNNMAELNRRMENEIKSISKTTLSNVF